MFIGLKGGSDAAKDLRLLLKALLLIKSMICILSYRNVPDLQTREKKSHGYACAGMIHSSFILFR